MMDQVAIALSTAMDAKLLSALAPLGIVAEQQQSFGNPFNLKGSVDAYFRKIVIWRICDVSVCRA